MSDKTESPTPKRLRKAREDGDSPISAFASQGVAFLVAVAVAPFAVAALAARSSSDLRAAIARAADAAPLATVDAEAHVVALLALSTPLLVAAGAAGAVTSFVQSGGVLSTKKLAPDLGRLDPVGGLRKLLSLDRVVAVLRAALFGGAVFGFAYGTLRAHAPDLARATGDAARAASVAAEMARTVAQRSAMLGLFLGVVDVVVTRRSWLKRLRMSKDEVKREHKESDGDPQLKAARERAHHEMLAGAAIANVRQASVVVVNPTHIACALRYDEGDGDEAPVLLAAGRGELAARIIEAARRYNVPVLQDVPLARALADLEVGVAIPEALYEAVAEILREAWDETERERER
jgi:flagellar biosynthesis protein FlhB